MPDDRQGGIVIGIVTSLDDPERLGRVMVKYPHLKDEKSDWARLVTGMAGPDRGLFLRPEVDDEVVVAFEHGDARRPYILGSVWSTQDKPPADDGNATKNNWRFIKSRSGHIIKLDDTQGAEKIEIVDKDGSHTLVIDSGKNEIRIVCDKGNVKVTANNGSVQMEAMSVSVKAQTDMSLEATGNMTIKGAIVNIN